MIGTLTGIFISAEKYMTLSEDPTLSSLPLQREDHWVFRELLCLTNSKTPVGVGDGGDDEIEGACSGVDVSPRPKSLAGSLAYLTDRQPAVLMTQVQCLVCGEDEARSVYAHKVVTRISHKNSSC